MLSKNAMSLCWRYAGQGLPSEEASQSGGQTRQYLRRAVQALTGLTESYERAVKELRLEPAEKYQAFLSVLDRDAHDSLAMIELALAQPVISSQLIDNLNASIRLRALLTDLFLIDEILNAQRQSGPVVTSWPELMNRAGF